MNRSGELRPLPVEAFTAWCSFRWWWERPTPHARTMPQQLTDAQYPSSRGHQSHARSPGSIAGSYKNRWGRCRLRQTRPSSRTEPSNPTPEAHEHETMWVPNPDCSLGIVRSFSRHLSSTHTDEHSTTRPCVGCHGPTGVTRRPLHMASPTRPWSASAAPTCSTTPPRRDRKRRRPQQQASPSLLAPAGDLQMPWQPWYWSL